MSRWIALLRGINVGGKNKLPMADLKSLLTDFELSNIQTYIQSGNVVFSSANLEVLTFTKDLRKAIEQRHGFAPQVLVLKSTDLQQTIERCPYPKNEQSEKILHYYFLTKIPDSPNIEKLNELKLTSEQWKLDGRTFYLYAPDGFGRSKLAAKAEGLLGVGATVRNWRTVHTISNLLKIKPNV